MFYFRLILIFLTACVLMTTSALCGGLYESDSQVWKVGERRWTIQEEYNYGKWIEANVTDDFFIRYKIPVDCADVPYALRWIYARISHLPAAATTINNHFIGHWSTDWRHLPTDSIWYKDRRFRAALMTMISTTSTRTLPYDVYPIRIDAESVTAGAIFLIPASHALVVSNIVTDGSTIHPVQTFEANLPTRTQKLFLRNFAALDPDPSSVSGLIKFRWPIENGGQWHYLPVKEHPFYSREQYSPSFTKECADYSKAVAKRIDPKVYDPREKIQKLIDTLTNRLKERIPIVLDGNQKCHANQCPEGSFLWELYGTPARDEFIQVTIDHLKEMIKENHLDQDAVLGQMAAIGLQISPNQFITAQYVFENAKWMSQDPKASIEARWGLDKCGIIAHRLKNAQDSISFIRKRYGNTDLQFAERSIGMQQTIVDEMTRESQENRCSKKYLSLVND
jgi:hypothetical protein